MITTCDVSGLRCYVTGASGFIGASLVRSMGTLDASGQRVDLRKDDGWGELLQGVDVIIHCAGISSGRGKSQSDIDFVNVEGTLRVAKVARDVGVRRFVFISSVKIFGEFTKEGEVFSDLSEVRPVSPYARSKALAEDGLRKMHSKGEIDVVIIRPTVVVGSGMKGAVATLQMLAKKGVPLLIPTVDNRRSFLLIENLLEAIRGAVVSPCASGKSYVASDESVISTRELYECLAGACKRKARFLRIDSGVGHRLSKIAGTEGIWHRLFGNLEVDGSLIRKELCCAPPTGTLEGLSGVLCQ